MKKSTLQSLVSFLNGETVTNIDEIKAEIEAELNKGQAKAEANRAVYEQAHDVVLAALSDTPVTAQEIADEVADALPGFSKGKIVYALNHYWESEVVKDSTGKVTTYHRA